MLKKRLLWALLLLCLFVAPVAITVVFGATPINTGIPGADGPIIAAPDGEVLAPDLDPVIEDGGEDDGEQINCVPPLILFENGTCGNPNGGDTNVNGEEDSNEFNFADPSAPDANENAPIETDGDTANPEKAGEQNENPVNTDGEGDGGQGGEGSEETDDDTQIADDVKQTDNSSNRNNKDKDNNSSDEDETVSASELARNQDRDNDGVADKDDRCPFLSSRGDKYGGENGSAGCPADTDKDGLIDGLDRCPRQAGVDANFGCPDDTVAPEEILDDEEPASDTTNDTIIVAYLPFDGLCQIATQNLELVNIRTYPDLEATINDVMYPEYAYPVLGSYIDDEDMWYLIESGWVATWVIRTGGDCDTVPELDLGQVPVIDSVDGS